MGLDGINGLNFNAYIGKTKNVQKADASGLIFKSNGVDKKGFYPELNFSPEAKMEAAMKSSPFMQGLNELFGIE